MSPNFLDYYDLGKPTRIDIDQINTFKDDKLFVLVGGTVLNKLAICEKYIQLSAINAEGRMIKEEIDSALNSNESFVLVDNIEDLNANKEKLLSAKKNFYTTILVVLESINEADKTSFETLLQDNTLVDFFVNMKRKI
jgi:hypothetical protein